MSILIDDFIKQMLIFFPAIREEYNQKLQEGFSESHTIIVEDVFMPELIKLLEKNDNEELLKRVFFYFEDVANSADEYLLNVFSITTLEILGNDSTILVRAKRYMGPKTTELQYKADQALGRI